MITLTNENFKILKMISSSKRGLSVLKLREKTGLTPSGLKHHTNRLVKKGKIRFDKKVHLFFAK